MNWHPSNLVKRGSSCRAWALAALLATFAFACCNVALAARTSEFGIGVFDSSVPSGSQSNAVFSPISFELDCSVFAEACDPITRANTAEALGVLTELMHFYQPLYQRLAATTNGYSFISARALCLPDIWMSYIEYRKRIHELCGAAVCSLWPSIGAERFLLSMMDGEMEDFSIRTPYSFSENKYVYYDLVSEKVSIATNAMPEAQIRTSAFITPSGSEVQIPFIYSPRANVDYCRSQFWQIVRVELVNGAWLYIIRPADNVSFQAMRERLKPSMMLSTMASVVSLTEVDAGSAYCELSIPLLDFSSVTDLMLGFRLALVPSQGFDFLDRSLTSRDAFQRMRLRIAPPEIVKSDETQNAGRKRNGDEDEEDEDSGAYNPGAQWRNAKVQWNAPRKDAGAFHFNTPFFFMIYHPELDVVSAIGQYMGL